MFGVAVPVKTMLPLRLTLLFLLKLRETGLCDDRDVAFLTRRGCQWSQPGNSDAPKTFHTKCKSCSLTLGIVHVKRPHFENWRFLINMWFNMIDCGISCNHEVWTI